MLAATDRSPGAMKYVDPSALCAVADWLANIFLTPPDACFVGKLQLPEATALLRELGEFFDCRDATQTIATIINAHKIPDITRVLQHSYTELFEGVSGPRTVLLYESAYRGNGHRLFQESLAEMNAILRRLDLSVGDECPEPADHLSIELSAFASAVRQGDVAEADLLAKRLQSWVPTLLHRLEERDQVGFYAAATKLLAVYLAALQPMALTPAGRERVVIQ